MPALKPCIEWYFDERLKRRVQCGDLSPNTRCPTHTRQYEKKRLEKEPWRHLYADPRWLTIGRKVFARDGYRCTYMTRGHRCNTTVPLQVHHETKLRHLWERAGKPQRGGSGWQRFVEMAVDMRNLRSLCVKHHKVVDNNNPAERWEGVPGEQATVGHHRREQRSRSRKKRTLRSTPGHLARRRRGLEEE